MASIGYSEWVGYKSVVVASVVPTAVDTDCTITDSPNLVKTSDGCFNVGFPYDMFYDGPINPLADNLIHRYSVELVDAYKSAVGDYYKKVKNKIVAKQFNFKVFSARKANSNSDVYTFTIDISSDISHLKTYGIELDNDAPEYRATYELKKVNNIWQTKFLNEENILKPAK